MDRKDFQFSWDLGFADRHTTDDGDKLKSVPVKHRKGLKIIIMMMMIIIITIAIIIITIIIFGSNENRTPLSFLQPSISNLRQ